MSRRIVRAATGVTLLIVTAIVMSEQAGFAQGLVLKRAADQNWGFGVDLGLLNGTTDRLVFALGGNVDYYVAENLSVGPMVQIAPGADFTQINSWAVAKLHFRTKYVDVAPFTGSGLTWARVGAGRLRSKSDDDASLSMVLGLELQFGLIANFAFAVSGMYAVYNLDFGEAGKDRGMGALMFGVRF